MNTSTAILLSALSFQGFAWNYAEAGANWGDESATCNGASQSPINLPVDGKGDNFKASVEAPNMALALSFTRINNNDFDSVGTPPNYYTIPGDGGSISLTQWDGSVVSGDFQRFDIHGSSNHRFDGEQRGLELQFYFSNNLALSVTYMGMDTYMADDGTEMTV